MFHPGAQRSRKVKFSEPLSFPCIVIYLFSTLMTSYIYPHYRGEQTATAMEANLTNLESKLDALLAAFEEMDEERGVKGAEKADEEDKGDGK